MNRCGHFFNQNKTARKCQKFGYIKTLPDADLKLTYAEYSFVLVGLSRRPLHIRYICVGKSSPTLKENKYNAGKRCQALANAVERSQTLVNIRKSLIAPDIKRS